MNTEGSCLDPPLCRQFHVCDLLFSSSEHSKVGGRRAHGRRPRSAVLALVPGPSSLGLAPAPTFRSQAPAGARWSPPFVPSWLRPESSWNPTASS